MTIPLHFQRDVRGLVTASTAMGLLALFPCSAMADNAPQIYRVVFDHPDVAGRVYSGDIRSIQRSYMVTNGVAGPTQKNGYSESSAKYVMTVSEVDPGGSPTIATINLGYLGSAHYPGDALEKSKLTGEVVVRIPSPTHPFIGQDGVPAPPDDSATLDSLFSGFFDSTPVTGDDMFGTRKLVSVGESWSGDNDAIARMVSAQLATTVDAAHTTGTATVNQMVTRNGVQCLDITMDIEVTEIDNPPMKFSFQQDAATIANGVTFQPDGATYSAVDRGLWPVNTALPQLEAKVDETYRLKMHVDGKPVELDFERVLEGSQTLVR